MHTIIMIMGDRSNDSDIGKPRPVQLGPPHAYYILTYQTYKYPVGKMEDFLK